MDFPIKPLITLLAIVNPIGVIPFFIHFTRNFYKYIPPRPLEEIDRDLEAVMNDLRSILTEVER